MFTLNIVYDNEAKPGFFGGWGFAALIETETESLLFDTGWDGSFLLKNLEKMELSLTKVQKLVLSHQHWDHIGGLPEVLKANPELTVYVPSSFSKNLKAEISKRAKLVEVKAGLEISPGVWSTGELGSKIKEQSLILKTCAGIYVLTGCAHPGLAEIMGAARHFGTVKGIIGGLHDSREFEELKGLKLIGAGHCTVHKKEIEKLYPAEFFEISTGLCLELE